MYISVFLLLALKEFSCVSLTSANDDWIRCGGSKIMYVASKTTVLV